MSLLSRFRRQIKPERSRPPAPKDACNYVLLILDSCRYDSMMSAELKNITKLGSIEKRYSYATWTAPSHYNLLMGLLPHPSPPNIFASTYYKQDFVRFQDRLNLPELSFKTMLPHMWLPHHLQNVGYYTKALVSLPVLNPHTPLAVGFDSYELLDNHNDLMGMISKMSFHKDRPTFYLLNTGETHYPYAPIDEPENQWPRIHGAHGVFKQLSSGTPIHQSEQPQFFNHDRLKQLHQRQIRVLSWVDRALESLFDIVPPKTFITITSDHGELFGENNYFGHGPINHEKVLEVPFVEGRLR